MTEREIAYLANSDFLAATTNVEFYILECHIFI